MTNAQTPALGERTTLGTVLAGIAACFGLVVSSALLAVIVAGSLQWMKPPVWLDNAVPLVVLGIGLMLSGRVATDVAGRWGPVCGFGAAVLVALVGTAVSRAGEAHGDGVEPVQIAIATAVVLLLTAGTAFVVRRRRLSRHGDR